MHHQRARQKEFSANDRSVVFVLRQNTEYKIQNVPVYVGLKLKLHGSGISATLINVF